MEAPTIDIEFERYWSKLTLIQKESILSVIKSFAANGDSVTIKQYNNEIDDAVSRVEEGEFYTHEEVKKM